MVDAQAYALEPIPSAEDVHNFFDERLARRGFVRDADVPERWDFDHSSDGGQAPRVAAYVRDYPAVNDTVERAVVVIVYTTPTVRSHSWSPETTFYTVTLGRGGVPAAQAAARPSYRTPGEHGMDRSLRGLPLDTLATGEVVILRSADDDADLW